MSRLSRLPSKTLDHHWKVLLLGRDTHGGVGVEGVWHRTPIPQRQIFQELFNKNAIKHKVVYFWWDLSKKHGPPTHPRLVFHWMFFSFILETSIFLDGSYSNKTWLSLYNNANQLSSFTLQLKNKDDCKEGDILTWDPVGSGRIRHRNPLGSLMCKPKNKKRITICIGYVGSSGD